MLVLSGVLIVILGFALRLNPLAVVAVAGLVTGVAGGATPTGVIEEFGRAFTTNRYVGIVWLVLPVIGLLERAGLRERVQDLITALQSITTARVLLGYLFLRQLTASIGMTALFGHAQMVRPLIAPMAEAAEERYGPITAATRMEIRAYAAATDNIGLFFGEDAFIAIGSVLLMQAFLEQSGYTVPALKLALWALPTAAIAFLVHGTRLLVLGRRLQSRRALAP
ncbi:MAG TPA: DUF969 domain-containing protein [Steroidobacteraceae bacterium]